MNVSFQGPIAGAASSSSKNHFVEHEVMFGFSKLVIEHSAELSKMVLARFCWKCSSSRTFWPQPKSHVTMSVGYFRFRLCKRLLASVWLFFGCSDTLVRARLYENTPMAAQLSG